MGVRGTETDSVSGARLGARLFFWRSLHHRVCGLLRGTDPLLIIPLAHNSSAFCFLKVFFRILVKALFAHLCAEVIRLPFVRGSPSRLALLDIHTADRIFRHKNPHFVMPANVYGLILDRPHSKAILRRSGKRKSPPGLQPVNFKWQMIVAGCDEDR